MTQKPARKEVALTGIKPTGVPHIGNYIGAIRPALRLAEHYQGLFLFVADYHALNSISSAKELRDDSYGVAATLLAAGLDPEKVVF